MRRTGGAADENSLEFSVVVLAVLLLITEAVLVQKFLALALDQVKPHQY